MDVGSCCSIGEGVTILLGGEYRKVFKVSPGLGDFGFSRGDVTIGHDVWLASGVTVLSGVTIGHGAVVVAGALATAVEDLRRTGENALTVRP